MAAVWEQMGWFGAWLVRSSLQASVLVVLILAAQGLLRRWLSARWRHALWLLVLLRLMLPSAPGAPWSVHNLAEAMAARAWRAWGGDTAQKPSAPEGPGASVAVVYAAGAEHAAADAAEEQARAAAPWRMTLRGALTLVWAAGAAALLLRLVVCNVRFHRRLGRLSRRPDRRALALLEECGSQMGVRRPVEVLETDAARVPALFGLFRPRLLLPAGFTGAIGQDELRHVLRHELAHLRRRDVPLNWLWAVLCAVHWFNPLIWLAMKRMQNDRELACDEAVLARTSGRGARAYGRTILKLLTALSRPARLAGVVGVMEGTRQARRRILMIASFKRSGRWGSVIGGALMLTLGATSLTNARCDSPESALLAGVADRGTVLPPPPAPRDRAALTAERASELSTRVYDTRDLLGIAGAPPPRLDDSATRPAAEPTKGREKAEERRLAEIVVRVRRAAGEKAWKPDGPGAITRHEGQLVVTQTGAAHRRIAGVLRELRGRARTQIQIDAKFLEARPKVIDTIGATWQALLPPGGEPEAPADPKRAPAAGKVVGSAEWSVRRPLPVRCAALTDAQVSRLLARTEQDKEARVLSSPRLLVLDGEAASILVGNRLPYVVDYAVKAGEDGKTTYDPIVKYAFQGIELALRVTRSADRKYFVLAAEPTVSKVVGASQVPYVASDGTATKRKIHVSEIETKRARTTASVAEGTTLALRGLPKAWGDPKPARRGEEIVLLVKPSELRPGEWKKPAP